MVMKNIELIKSKLVNVFDTYSERGTYTLTKVEGNYIKYKLIVNESIFLSPPQPNVKPTISI